MLPPNLARALAKGTVMSCLVLLWSFQGRFKEKCVKLNNVDGHLSNMIYIYK